MRENTTNAVKLWSLDDSLKNKEGISEQAPEKKNLKTE